MSNTRLIARLDVKGPNLIKGIRLEGLRVLGDPQVFAKRYYDQGIDEIIYMDIVASLYERQHLLDIVRHTAQYVFVPIAVGGGVRSVEDALQLLRAGADKIVINTAATKDPELIKKIAYTLGSQCVVLSIEAKRLSDMKWEAYVDNGRERTGLDVLEWVKKGVALGAGEVLLTSVDQEGTRKGFDLDLVRAVAEAVSVPVIASGGMGHIDHLVDVVKQGKADAVAMADVLHYRRLDLHTIRERVGARGIRTREIHACS